MPCWSSGRDNIQVSLCGGQSSHTTSDFRWHAKRAEHASDLADMPGGKADRVAFTAKSVSGVVQWNAIQKVLQNDPLNGFELLFGRFD